MASLDPNAYARGVASVPQINLLAGQQQQTANLMNLIKVKQMGQEMQDKQALRNAMAGVDVAAPTAPQINALYATGSPEGVKFADTLQARAEEAENARLTRVAGIVFAASQLADDAAIDSLYAPALEKDLGAEGAAALISSFKQIKPEDRPKAAMGFLVQQPKLLEKVLPYVLATQNAQLSAQVGRERIASTEGIAERQIASREKVAQAGITSREEIAAAARAQKGEQFDTQTKLKLGENTPSGYPITVHTKLDAAFPAATDAVEGLAGEAQRTQEVVQRLINNPDGVEEIAGRNARVAAATPELLSDAGRQALADIEFLGGKAFVGGVLNIKNLSPTGSGVGSVSEQEGKKLQASQVNLNLLQPSASLLKRIEEYGQQVTNSASRVRQSYQRDYGYRLNRETSAPAGGGAAPAAPATPRAAVTPPPNAIEFLRANPDTRDQFDGMFGPGSSAQYLGR